MEKEDLALFNRWTYKCARQRRQRLECHEAILFGVSQMGRITLTLEQL